MQTIGVVVATAMALCLLAQPSRAQTASCQGLLDHYLDKHHKEAAPYTGDNMLYFLHVPRTAGRTFHSCLLKMGMHPGRRCPKAYDHLRITNMSTPNCYLLSSHDDFSVVSMLPDNVAVLTQVRDPVDRFLSAYEFAIEVAARSLRRPKNYRKKLGRISTEDVWPWSYLIPFFAEDMRPKVEAAQKEVVPAGGRWVEVEQDGERFWYNKALDRSKWKLTEDERAAGGGAQPLLDPYDNHLVMSLKDFAEHPVAAELLHNGATFQVLGITNYSHWGDAAEFRSCVKSHPEVASTLSAIATQRVKRFTHVGTTDRLFDSAASALVSMKLGVEHPAYAGGEDDVAGAVGGRQRRGGGGGGDDDVGDEYGGGGGGGGGAAGGGRRGGAAAAAAQVQLMAKLVREARARLQEAQKELIDMMKGQANPEHIEALRNKVDSARQGLIDAQDKLADARDKLPADLGGRAGMGRRRLMGVDSGSEADRQLDVGQGAARHLQDAAAEGSGLQQQDGDEEEEEEEQVDGEDSDEEDEDRVEEAEDDETGTQLVSGAAAGKGQQGQGRGQGNGGAQQEQRRRGHRRRRGQLRRRRQLLSAGGEAAQGGGEGQGEEAGGGRSLQALFGSGVAAASTVDSGKLFDAFGTELDPNFKKLPNTNLGMEFQRCANRAQARSSVRRDQSLAVLSTADGRRVTFSKAARSRIPQDVIQLIRSHNAMDLALHATGLQLLDARIAEHKAAGTFKDLPPLPKGDQGGGGGGAPNNAKNSVRFPHPEDEVQEAVGSDEL